MDIQKLERLNYIVHDYDFLSHYDYFTKALTKNMLGGSSKQYSLSNDIAQINEPYDQFLKENSGDYRFAVANELSRIEAIDNHLMNSNYEVKSVDDLYNDYCNANSISTDNAMYDVKNNKFEKTLYSGEFQGKEISRYVYQNNDLDPYLKVPAGTKYSNGRMVDSDISNFDLMKNGQAPFVMDENGEYTQLELHHLTGQESLRGNEFFNSDTNAGSMVELEADKHDEYSSTIHIPKEKNESFRVDSLTGGVSDDAKQYTKFREEYWKSRAEGFEASEEQGPEKQENSNDNEKTAIFSEESENVIKGTESENNKMFDFSSDKKDEKKISESEDLNNGEGESLSVN